MKGNWRKGIAIFCLIIAILLSDLMCAVVAFNYVDIVWGIRFAGYQMLPSSAFRMFIPFGIAIVFFLCLFILFWYRGKQHEEKEHDENVIPRKRMGKRVSQLVEEDESE